VASRLLVEVSMVLATVARDEASVVDKSVPGLEDQASLVVGSRVAFESNPLGDLAAPEGSELASVPLLWLAVFMASALAGVLLVAVLLPELAALAASMASTTVFLALPEGAGCDV